MNKSSEQKVHREPFHRAHRNFFVGLFVLIPLVAIPSFTVYTLAKTEFFEDWCLLHVQYETNYGLKEGDAVMVSGIRIGHVKSVRLTDRGRAHVTFRVLTRKAHLIRKNSKAILKQKNMAMGDWEIELTLGDSTAAAVQEGDTLAPELPLQIDKVIGQVTSMVSTFEKILEGIAEGEGVVGKLLKEDTLVTVVGAILTDIHRVVRRTDRTLRAVDTTLAVYTDAGIGGVVLIDSLAAMVREIKPVIADAGQLMTTVDGVGRELFDLVEQTEKSITEVELLIKGMQKHWLLRRSVRKAERESNEEE